jgi:ATP-binding cassette subfamily C protein
MGAEDRVCADIGVHIDSQARLARAVGRLAAWRLLVVSLGSRLPVAFILLATPRLLDDGTSPGEIAGSLTYALAIIGPAMAALSEGFGAQVVPMWVTLARLLETAGPLNPPPRGSSDVAAEPVSACDRAGDVVVDGLTFGYGPGAEPVLRDFDLTVRHGEHFAVVGPSGIGKSTLAALICGMLTPSAGAVRVGTHDIARTAPDIRAGVRVLIPQEAFVFTGTVRDNLLYLNPGATADELDRAVAAVGMQGLLDRLGDYDATLLPHALSAGQRQLIALTRAYLSPAPLAVLDEATCYLDPEAEARAEQAFAGRRGTLIVVAHRISSALRAHRILVLDGTSAKVGTHEQLLGDSALYRDLVGHWSARDATTRSCGSPPPRCL